VSGVDDIKLLPIGSAIGLTITGWNLRNLQTSEFARIKSLLTQHLVLRFPGQDINDQDQLNITRHFGALDHIPRVLLGGQPRDEMNPALETISNVIEDGRPIGSLGNEQLSWHSDVPFVERPYGVCVLRAIEIPQAGGDFHFANMYSAFDSLPGPLQLRIEGLHVKQNGSMTRGGQPRSDVSRINGDSVSDIRAIHPLVRSHPENNRRYLYLGRRQHAEIVGLGLSESEALLDELWHYATLPKHCCSGQWELGDVIIWDNRCTLHRRDGFNSSARRTLRRTSAEGERPFL
jgi:taurine dioxygenase